MKYLTPIYSTLMHAFKYRADEVLKEKQAQIDPVNLMREYCTLRIDGGRQSGKTEAVSEFAANWLMSGGSVSVLAYTQSFARNTEHRIKKELMSDEYNSNIVTMSIRDFLSDNCNKYRGRSFNRMLFIIDEPMKLPELIKFYERYCKDVIYSVQRNTDELPLFFVIGIQ